MEAQIMTPGLVTYYRRNEIWIRCEWYMDANGVVSTKERRLNYFERIRLFFGGEP